MDLRQLKHNVTESTILPRRGQGYKVGDSLKVKNYVYKCLEDTTELPPMSSKWVQTHKIVPQIP